MIRPTVSPDWKMARWSSLSSAVGLLFLFGLNGGHVISKESDDTISPEDVDLGKERIYCQLKNCPADLAKPHYGCNTTDIWSQSCGNTPFLITMTDKMRNFIARTHNSFRDTVAGGLIPGLPPAARMLKLAWDHDLADIAQILVRRCDLRPTKQCISTMQFNTPGLNEAYNKFQTKLDVFRIVKSQLFAWYNQHRYISEHAVAHGASMSKESLKKSEVRHFERMIIGPSNRVGCAIAVTKRDGWTHQWLTCLYGCSPKQDTVIYQSTSASLPGHLCSEGVDGTFQHLCSDKEVANSCQYTPHSMAVTSRIRAIMHSRAASLLMSGLSSYNMARRYWVLTTWPAGCKMD